MSESLLEELLSKQDPQVQSDVRRIVQETGIRENDPTFLLMVAVGTVQVLVKNAPTDLAHTYQTCHEKVVGQLKEYEQTAARGIQREITGIVNDVLKKARAEAREPGWRVFLVCGAMTITVLLAGAIAGFAMGDVYRSTLRESGKLTAAEKSSLNWAISEEGQFARKLMAWNSDAIDGSCQEQVKAIGLKLEYGALTTDSGFCTLWVVPPKERNFRKR